jgi:hypothetical protein
MSSLLELDSSFTRSAIGESTTTTQTHEKKWKSPTWWYYYRLAEDKNQEFLYCTQCPLDLALSPYGTKVLENIKKHLLRYHEIIVEKPLSKNQEEVNV